MINILELSNKVKDEGYSEERESIQCHHQHNKENRKLIFYNNIVTKVLDEYPICFSNYWLFTKTHA